MTAEVLEHEEDVKASKLTALVWQMFKSGATSDQILTRLNAMPEFRDPSLNPQLKEDFRNFVSVIDQELSPAERINAAMRISGNVSAGTDQAAERFFSKIFEGISLDGNLDNDREKIKSIETALSKLTVNGVKLDIEVDGVADNRLAALLRTPEVVKALDEAMKKGLVQDLAFKPDYDFTPKSVMAVNTECHDRGRS